MIARLWRGYTTRANADAYEAMLKPDLLPGLSQTQGFRGSILMRHDRGDEVEFVTMILWDSLDDLRALTGADYETPVIPEERKAVLLRWDKKATHYDVCATRLWVSAFR